VVDDSAVVRRMVGVILERSGHEVRFAQDGVEGLAEVRTSPPDLVMTDVEMPRMDGLAFVRQARSGGATLPIVMMTANPEIEDDEALRGLGVDAFTTKPLRSTEVIALVTSLLARDRS